MAVNKRELVGRLLEEVWGKGNLALLPDLLSEGISAHVAAHSEAIEGIDDYRRFVAAYNGLLGEVRFSVEDQLEEGDRLATRWTAWLPSGENEEGPRGEQDLLPVMGISIHRFADDRIAESWDTWDALSAMGQSRGLDVLDALDVGL